MGAWSVESFGNDTACDWSYELEEARDLSVVHATLRKVLSASDKYLDSSEACEAIAACEVIARLQGNFGVRDAYTETVDQWVKSHPTTPSSGLITDAVNALDRILAPQSELCELWDEDGPDPEWHAAMADLRSRVSA